MSDKTNTPSSTNGINLAIGSMSIICMFVNIFFFILGLKKLKKTTHNMLVIFMCSGNFLNEASSLLFATSYLHRNSFFEVCFVQIVLFQLSINSILAIAFLICIESYCTIKAKKCQTFVLSEKRKKIICAAFLTISSVFLITCLLATPRHAMDYSECQPFVLFSQYHLTNLTRLFSILFGFYVFFMIIVYSLTLHYLFKLKVINKRKQIVPESINASRFNQKEVFVQEQSQQKKNHHHHLYLLTSYLNPYNVRTVQDISGRIENMNGTVPNTRGRLQTVSGTVQHISVASVSGFTDKVCKRETDSGVCCKRETDSGVCCKRETGSSVCSDMIVETEPETTYVSEDDLESTLSCSPIDRNLESDVTFSEGETDINNSSACERGIAQHNADRHAEEKCQPRELTTSQIRMVVTSGIVIFSTILLYSPSIYTYVAFSAGISYPVDLGTIGTWLIGSQWVINPIIYIFRFKELRQSIANCFPCR